MEKLVCDRCGIEYTDTESVEGAKRHQEKWAKLCREDGVEPRGLSACPIITCAGELQLKEQTVEERTPSSRVVKISPECRGVLTLLVREVQDCKDKVELDRLLDSWIKANDLHPEEVETLSDEEFRRKYG